MKTFESYTRALRPCVAVEGYFARPKSLLDFLSTLSYFDFDVEFGAFYASLNIAVFSFGFKIAFNDPLMFKVALHGAGGDITLDFGIEQDWEKEEVLRFADEKRERFLEACAAAELAGSTIDAADWESKDSLKERIRATRREFSNKFWKTMPDDAIDIGNSMWLVFKPEGVFVECRPEEALDAWMLRTLGDKKVEATASLGGAGMFSPPLDEADAETLQRAIDKIFPRHVDCEGEACEPCAAGDFPPADCGPDDGFPLLDCCEHNIDHEACDENCLPCLPGCCANPEADAFDAADDDDDDDTDEPELDHDPEDELVEAGDTPTNQHDSTAQPGHRH